MVPIAKILLFLQIIVIAAAVGAAAAFFGLLLVATLLGASDMEGGLAMGAAGFAPVGAVAGAVLWGVVCVADDRAHEQNDGPCRRFQACRAVGAVGCRLVSCSGFDRRKSLPAGRRADSVERMAVARGGSPRLG